MKTILVCIFCLIPMLSMQAQTLYGTASTGGTITDGDLIFRFDARTKVVTTVHSFEGVESNPFHARLLRATDGKYYGMTVRGGHNSNGAFFSFDPSTQEYKKVHDFKGYDGSIPKSGLIQVGGKLYGMTAFGGDHNGGVIFSLELATYAFTKLYDFHLYNNPVGDLLFATDGKLYGMTSNLRGSDAGTIFSFDPASFTYVTLKHFDWETGAYPEGSLIQTRDGKLYGMTSGGGKNWVGVIFSYDIQGSHFSKLFDFEYLNGGIPTGELIEARDGKLYGMTSFGGAQGKGSIFSFEPISSTYITLMSFDATTGENPYGSFTQAADGKLYGMTSEGGSSNHGTLFSFDPSIDVFTKLKDFNGTDGAGARGSLIESNDGKLIGMTSYGGSTYTGTFGQGNFSGSGVIFSFDYASSTFTKLKDLGTNETGTSAGSMIKASNGMLYGMTTYGGAFGAGVIYAFDPASNSFTKLRDFERTNGAHPQGSLVEANDGKLYGMAASGGINEQGVLFSFDPTSAQLTKLKEFNTSNGAAPYGSLVHTSDGKLYGMTSYGGRNSGGVIFSFDPFSSTYTHLYDFLYATGSSPHGKLTEGSDGKLYGITFEGGAKYNGVIFSFDPLSGHYAILKELSVTEGGGSLGSLILNSDEKLYGLARNGGNHNAGVIFSFDPLSLEYKNVHDFDLVNGAFPTGNLMRASDGKLYAIVDVDGLNNTALIFSFTPATSTFTRHTDLQGLSTLNHNGATLVEVGKCISISTYHQDSDKDGFGNSAYDTTACSQPAGYVDNNKDCDDTKPSVHPGAREICNGIDDDCDGSVDEGFINSDYDELPDCVDTDDDNDGIPDFSDCAPLDRKNDKVLICHKGNTICVSQNAVGAHLKHGDSKGACRSNPISFTNNTSLEKLAGKKGGGNLPKQFALSNYPNPFVGMSTIRYELPVDSKVSVKVYDILGRLVGTLVDGDRKAGVYTVNFRAGSFNNGAFFYRMIATSEDGRFEQTNKMIKAHAEK